MTTPDERTRAVLDARRFLVQLAAHAEAKCSMAEVRETAQWLLRHYPGAADLYVTALALPLLWAPPQTGGNKC